MDENTPYVRIRKMWDRNSGWAQYSWLYYVDIVNAEGKSAREVAVSCHAGEMDEYGKGEGAARVRANKIAEFFGWEVREFEQRRETTTTMREVNK